MCNKVFLKATKAVLKKLNQKIKELNIPPTYWLKGRKTLIHSWMWEESPEWNFKFWNFLKIVPYFCIGKRTKRESKAGRQKKDPTRSSAAHLYENCDIFLKRKPNNKLILLNTSKKNCFVSIICKNNKLPTNENGGVIRTKSISCSFCSSYR